MNQVKMERKLFYTELMLMVDAGIIHLKQLKPGQRDTKRQVVIVEEGDTIDHYR